MLVQRRWRWANIETALGQILAFAGSLITFCRVYWTSNFFINSVFHHLELEIALAIPAPNDEKHQELI